MVWKTLETCAVSGVTLAVSILMTRLLAPHVFGAVAVLQVFVVCGQAIAEGGVVRALVRHPYLTRRLKDTAFVINLALGLTVYAVVFGIAPSVSQWYAMPELTGVLRVLGMCIPLSALSSVPEAILTGTFRFGKIFIIGLSSVVAGGLTGIVMAMYGYGVWALAGQQLAMWVVRALLSMCMSGFACGLTVDGDCIKGLFRFGWKLSLASFINALLGYLYAPVIGACFNITEAGLFWRAQSLASYPGLTGSTVMDKVGYPVQCRLDNNGDDMSHAMGLLIKGGCGIMFPGCALLAALAGPLFGVLFTPAWVGAVPYFRLLCAAYMFYPLHTLLVNTLNARGRSDLFLKAEVIKFVLALSILLVSVQISVAALCVGIFCSGVLALIVNMQMSRRWSGLTWRRLSAICMPLLFCSVTAGAAAWGCTVIIENEWGELCAGTCVFALIYSLTAYMLNLGLPWRYIQNVKI